jgi:hypothetical protein
MQITGSFVARRVNDDPPGFRVWFDDGTGELEVGSIGERKRHVMPYTPYWHWGVDTMPFNGGSPSAPSGETTDLNDAIRLFREEFLRWVNELPPGTWNRSRDHIRARKR